jgi:FkbM family methyltransferase
MLMAIEDHGGGAQLVRSAVGRGAEWCHSQCVYSASELSQRAWWLAMQEMGLTGRKVKTMLDTMLGHIAKREGLANLLIPILRGYLRYFPVSAGKRSFWSRVVHPHFAWQSHPFVAPTIFGSRVVGNTSELLQQYIYYFGLWEPYLTRWITTRLRPGDMFVDVGANIGYFSLLASKLVGKSGKVVAIEPSPKTFRMLQHNLAINRAHNVRALNMAAADKSELVEVFGGNKHFTGLANICAVGNQERGFVVEGQVQAAPLSEILGAAEIKTARLVKIDVEGSEWRVMEGLSELFLHGRGDLEFIVEINPECGTLQGRRPEEIVRAFQGAGFHLYRIENDYDAVSYLPPFHAGRPVRMHGPIERLTDAIFSRQDLKTL